MRFFKLRKWNFDSYCDRIEKFRHEGLVVGVINEANVQIKTKRKNACQIMHIKHFIMYAIRIATCCIQNSTQKRRREKKKKRTYRTSKSDCDAYKNNNHFVGIKKFQSVCNITGRWWERGSRMWYTWRENGWSVLLDGGAHWTLTIVEHPFEHDLGF